MTRTAMISAGNIAALVVATIEEREARQRIKELLGGRLPHNFCRLPKEVRTRILRRSQIKQGKDGERRKIRFDSATTMEHVPAPYSGWLRDERYVGTSDEAQQVIEEARQIFYGSNYFVVPLHELESFAEDDSPSLVKHTIVFRIGVHDRLAKHRKGYNSGSSQGSVSAEKLSSARQRLLGQLFKFTEAATVSVVLRGGRELNGSDAATQKTIRDIALVVQELLEQRSRAGKTTKIINIHEGRGGRVRSFCLRRYWGRSRSTSTRSRARRTKG